MNFIKKIERYQKIDKLILQQCTGTPNEFANKLGINRSHLYRLLDQFKDYGANIEYNRKEQTFYYVESFKLSNILSINNMEYIEGGINLFPTVSFYETEHNYFSNCNYTSFN